MRDDAASYMHMVGQGMPYIKQESGVSEMHPNSSHGPNVHLAGQKDEKGASMGPGDLVRFGMNRDGGKMSSGNHQSDEQDMGGRTNAMEEGRDGGGRDDKKPDVNRPPKISTPSFSSEGMFLHPSGYVAYGGIEDEEEGQDANMHGNGSEGNDQSQHSQGSGHRRKPSIVHKRYSESPDNRDDPSRTHPEDPNTDPANSVHKFHPLNPNTDHSTADMKGNEVGEEDGSDGGDDDKDNGEVLDDKHDPPYHGSSHIKNGIHGSGLRHPTRHQQGSQHATIETRSHSRRMNSNHSNSAESLERMNSTVASDVPAGGLTYAGPGAAGNSNSSPGHVKVNNRVSLVNFTADELINHLMKRDDVNRCQFCSLVFQDAAMYHIHRNMHDKQDIRRCNMCGKLLHDKYDFTAHFLSMHQS